MLLGLPGRRPLTQRASLGLFTVKVSSHRRLKLRAKLYKSFVNKNVPQVSLARGCTLISSCISSNQILRSPPKTPRLHFFRPLVQPLLLRIRPVLPQGHFRKRLHASDADTAAICQASSSDYPQKTGHPSFIEVSTFLIALAQPDPSHVLNARNAGGELSEGS